MASTVLGGRPVPKEQTVQSENLNPIENGPDNKNPLPKVILKPSNGYSIPKLKSLNVEDNQAPKLKSVNMEDNQAPIKYRPLKLVYDHDIRLAQIPVNSSFKILRAVVGKRFPMLKTVLIKFKDSDGDLVTIMRSSDLRLAESSVDNDEKQVSTFSVLRLHIVQVNQEPPSLEEEEEEEIEELKPKEVAEKEKTEVFDDWLLCFGQLFLTHVGIDPYSHIDLHKPGMELLSKALMETVTSEEAQTLFDKAASEFEEIAATAFYNWGNVLLWVAQKRMPIVEAGPKKRMEAQLKKTYDLARKKYTLAKGKYEEALLINPRFCHALFALARHQFEMAKLHWSFVLAKKSDLSKWDPTETIWLFDSGETQLRAATKMWEKMEEQRAIESKLGRKDEVSEWKNQNQLFWGKMLFLRSHIECKLRLTGWDKSLDAAVERFKLAGLSESDISTILKKHPWNCNEEEKVEELMVSANLVVEKGDD